MTKNASGASGKSAGSPPPPRAAGGDLFGDQDAPPALRQRQEQCARRRRKAGQAGQIERRPDAPRARRRARRGGAQDAGRSQQVPDRPQPRPSSTAWIARVHDVGHFAIEAKATSIDPMQAEMCGIALALAPNDACYVPLAHKQSGDGAGLFAAGLAPDQIRAGRRAGGAAAAAGIGRHPEDRLQHQVQRRDAGAARHHPAQPRRRAADVLCARRRPQFARARCAGRTLARPRHHQPWRTDRQRQGASSPSIRSRSTGRPPIRPRMPT